MTDTTTEIVHAWEEPGYLPCCNRQSIEVPYYHRLTLDPGQVTCEGPEDGDS